MLSVEAGRIMRIERMLVNPFLWKKGIFHLTLFQMPEIHTIMRRLMVG